MMYKLKELFILCFALILTTILASLIIRFSFIAVSPSGFVSMTSTQIWVHRMIQAESNNRSEIVVFDSNHQLSYSCGQFQRQTFEYQVKKYNLLPEAEPREYLNFIRDCTFQRELARNMIEDNPANADHWRNTTKKIGKPPLFAL